MFVTEQALKRQNRLRKAGGVLACGSGTILICMAVYGLVSGFLGYFMLSVPLAVWWVSLFEDVLRRVDE